ncbi:MAG: VCBS repeat-containing protein [Candidatus Midichloria sp.]|nr:VCBS repeat-containing protein [Candidatus Midichloria sp.]
MINILPTQTRAIQPAVSYVVGNEAPLIIAAADFNLDGKMDIVNTNSDGNSVALLLGRGDGTFHSAVLYSIGDNSPWGGAIVDDFNRDGNSDIATTNRLLDNVARLLGNGNGTLKPAVPYNVGNYPTGITVGDFNQDGRLDMVNINMGPLHSISANRKWGWNF